MKTTVSTMGSPRVTTAAHKTAEERKDHREAWTDALAADAWSSRR
jgi:hypothetical protein